MAQANQNFSDDVQQRDLRDLNFMYINIKSSDKSDEIFKQNVERICSEHETYDEDGASKYSKNSTDELKDTVISSKIDEGDAAKCCADFPNERKSKLFGETKLVYCSEENILKKDGSNDLNNTETSKKSDVTDSVLIKTENKKINCTEDVCSCSSVAHDEGSDELNHDTRTSVVHGSDADLLDLIDSTYNMTAGSTVNTPNSQHHHGYCPRDTVFASSENKIPDRHASFMRSSEDDNTEYCPKHKNSAINYFCKSCDTVGCKMCMSLEHGNCVDVKSMREIVTSGVDRVKYKTLIGTLTRTEYELEKRKDGYHSNCRRKDFLYEKAMTFIRKEREKVTRLFDDVERVALDSVMAYDKENEKKLESAITRNETMRDTLIKLKSELQERARTGQNYKLFVTMRDTERELMTFQDEFKRIDKDNSIAYYEFAASNEVSSALKSIKSLGTLVFLSITATFVADVNVQKSKAMPYAIRDMCILSGNRLVIADTTNRVLKVLAANRNKTLSVVAMTSEPWGVTKTDNSSSVATLPREKTVHFLSVTKSSNLTKSDKVLVHHQYSGIAHSRGNLIVSCLLENAVHILNMNGTLLKIFCTDFAGHRKYTLASFHSLSPVLSSDEETIYVLDNLTKVTSLSLDGELKAVFNDADLVKPRGITVDQNGNIYVCGLQSNNVHVLTKDLVSIKVLLNNDDGIDGPESLAFCDNTLYVGMKNKIKVFKIR